MDLPKPYTKCCYGGNFAVKASNANANKHTWYELKSKLSRDNFIEEGHIAERVWAGLLSRPLTLAELHTHENIVTEKWQAVEHAGTLRLKILRH